MCGHLSHAKGRRIPSSILKAKGYVIYCEVAEKEGRTPPGVQGDDFRPYFTALKKLATTIKL